MAFDGRQSGSHCHRERTHERLIKSHNMVVSCSVYGCLSTSQSQSNRSFFRFPKDERRCKLWMKAADRPDLLNKSVEDLYRSHVMCDLHFKAEDRNLKKLRSDAVPSLNLPLRDKLHATISTQTDVNTSQYFLKYEISTQTTPNDIDATEYTTQDPMSEDDHDCSASTTSNYDTGILPQVKDSYRGNRNDTKIKLMALNLFFTSPLSYRVVAKFLSLPSVRELLRMKIDMGTKVDSKTLSYLQTKLKNLPELDRYCIVCADEISLKRNLHYVINKDKIVGFHEVDGIQTDEPATQAYVVMVRGIFSNWQLPIGYCLLASSEKYEELKSWFDGLISKILKIGYYVVGFVTGQGSNFIKLANERNVSVDKPYFFIDDRKIYNIFDVPDLFKSLRNNFMKYNFEFLNSDGNKVTAKWEHVKTLHDSAKSHRLAPKLTDAHINPNHFEKMEVKYATQVLSYTVAAAMDFILDKSCSGTVQFISLMDKTFDVLNSSTVKNQNKNKNAYAAKQHQTEILNEFEHFLSTVAVVNDKKQDVTKSIKCLQSFKITLSSIRSLAKDLQSVGIRFLLTHRLNKDPIEKNFSSSRRQRNSRKPTPFQFSRDFYKLYMMNMLKQSDLANSSNDFNTLLKYAKKKVASIQQQKEEGVYSDGIPTVTVGTLDYRFELPENNAFLYVCCYLLKKCTEVHKCESMITYLGSNSQLSDESIFSSSSNQSKNILITPPKSFIACIKAMDDKFKLCLQKSIPESIGNHVLKELSHISMTKCCPCFPNEYLRKLFVRFRLFNVIRFNNRVLKYKSFKVKSFSVCNI